MAEWPMPITAISTLAPATVENACQHLRANKLAISVFSGYDSTVAACCAARDLFANDPAKVTSITSRSWAQVNV